MSSATQIELAREAVYGAKFAPVYDQIFASLDTARALRTLLPLAVRHGGRVLDLGTGTGRLAIGLARGGCEVVGVDISPEMLAVLRNKYRGTNLRAIIGDIAYLENLRLGEFGLVILAFNSIFHLLTLERQHSCVAGAARMLRSEGLFVIETSSPEGVLPARRCELRLRREDQGPSLVVRMRNSAGTRVRGWNVTGIPPSMRIRTFRQRYSTLDQLDQFAGDAGLALRDRWGDWSCRPWTSAAPWAISVYQSVIQS
jgi:ubiquinone/menaquinone biosynthesis C-methylase UbiE